MTLGNGLTETSVYNNREEPCRININSSGTYLGSCTDSIPNGNVQDFSYSYSNNWNNGDVWSWTATGVQHFNRSYTYDGINRLSTMSAPGDTCSGLSWTYDAWGNRTDQSVTGGTCNTLHVAVNSNNQFVGPPYQYDAAGNLINDGLYTYSYDAENRLVTVNPGSSPRYTYYYDAEGRRVGRYGNTGLGVEYLPDLSGQVATELQNGTFSAGYVYFNAELLAQYANSTTYFVLSDHLGSTRLLTSMNRSIYDSMDYLPFGEQIAGASGTSYKFTGKQRDAETGNDYFGARYYSSLLGRFLSADWSDTPSPVPYANQADPESLNLAS
jgi:RHS repeat-associated protein